MSNWSEIYNAYNVFKDKKKLTSDHKINFPKNQSSKVKSSFWTKFKKNGAGLWFDLWFQNFHAVFNLHPRTLSIFDEVISSKGLHVSFTFESVAEFCCLLQAIEMQTKQGVCHKKIRPKISFSSLLLQLHFGSCPFWCWLQGLFALFLLYFWSWFFFYNEPKFFTLIWPL